MVQIHRQKETHVGSTPTSTAKLTGNDNGVIADSYYFLLFYN